MPNRPPKLAPAPPPSFRPGRGPITGLDVARTSGAKIVIGQPGDDCCYAWPERVIVLSPKVAQGTDIHSLLIAAEEAAHHRQPRWVHYLRSWIPFVSPIVRWWEEADAFRRVKRLFCGA